MKRVLPFVIASLILLAQPAMRPSDLMQPAALAAVLKGSGPKPAVVFVGFPVLYRSTRIPGALLAGPGARSLGIEELKRTVAKLPKDKEIVLYCGCCPFGNCPNVRPALEAMKAMGYTKVKVLEIRENLSSDWVSKGYPTEKTAGASGF
ncbi:MAG: rhodanese-like domain-containing protein [Acidobacteria bacterium]|nr:rhodanese-like domain-containing protein [Acidobacteriota bacterium]